MAPSGSEMGKVQQTFINMVDNKAKDHQGIAPDQMHYPDSWYITCLKPTLEPHTTLCQYIINHQMQADLIVNHLSTASTTISFLILAG